MSATNRTRNVRLADLSEPATAAAANSGMTVSEWIRRAVAESLKRPMQGTVPDMGPSTGPSTSPSTGTGSKHRLVLRMPAADLARWRTEAQQHGLSLNQYIVLQMSVTGDAARRIAVAVETLRGSTVALAAVGRNLNQITRSWNTYPGQSTAGERALLAQACAATNAHRSAAARLLADLGEIAKPRRRQGGRTAQIT